MTKYLLYDQFCRVDHYNFCLFGVEPRELITGLSILAASIAIITKDIAPDIICGIQISFSKDLAIGDYVKIGDQKGNVVDINISKIILQNENDDEIYIPNSKAYFSEMINYTKKEIRKYNLEFAIHHRVIISTTRRYVNWFLMCLKTSALIWMSRAK
ncbi:MAG: mechanosensitive ion channel [Saprospiraceae bacterium]